MRSATQNDQFQCSECDAGVTEGDKRCRSCGAEMEWGPGPADGGDSETASARVLGLESITPDQLSLELQSGGRFVVFEYCISILFVTFRQTSEIYFIRSNEGTFGKSIGYTVVSLVLGWWGIPWGPIYTVASLFTNLKGGRDVTDTVRSSLNYPT